MFGKLLKYEFKATYKWYLILFSILIAVSLLSALLLGPAINFNLPENTAGAPAFGSFILYSMLIMLLASAVAGLNISNTIIIIVRFYRNIFGREGYLTWTLPVSNHQILLAKLLTAVFWTFLGGLLIGLSILGLVLLFLVNIDANLTEIFSYLLRIDFSFFVLLFLRLAFGTVASILSFYLAMAIGHLFKSYRILMSFLFGFLIITASNIIGIFIPSLNPFNPFSFIFSGLNYDNWSVTAVIYFGFFISIAIEVAKIIGFYLAVAAITKKRLNLQ